MIFNTFTRRVGNVMMKNKRFMSGGGSQAEAIAECDTWKKATIGMVGLSVALGVYCFIVSEHEHGRTGLSYQKIRTKPYPWSCSDCNLFSPDCWKECRAAKQ
eukprot:CAMPEP_0181339332 /NCGR_PEP_ID=MMETSP1101-20121128/29192_1 /TAXON_ID=46948 /ORGANISM="Rhodomonas abbreviata, Strain Caron Lab Isolate" /LENGTH=101 /DNA_ID=CAMNT_0023450279 /DNA_START=55 /DNA_END=360 /DNA_ORIENTATION=-